MKYRLQTKCKFINTICDFSLILGSRINIFQNNTALVSVRICANPLAESPIEIALLLGISPTPTFFFPSLFLAVKPKFLYFFDFNVTEYSLNTRKFLSSPYHIIKQYI